MDLTRFKKLLTSYGSIRRILRWALFILCARLPTKPGVNCLYDARKPELNRIVMGFLFHRLIVLGRGVTDLVKRTAAAQAALAEVTSSP